MIPEKLRMAPTKDSVIIWDRLDPIKQTFNREYVFTLLSSTIVTETTVSVIATKECFLFEDEGEDYIETSYWVPITF